MFFLSISYCIFHCKYEQLVVRSAKGFAWTAVPANVLWAFVSVHMCTCALVCVILSDCVDGEEDRGMGNPYGKQAC